MLHPRSSARSGRALALALVTLAVAVPALAAAGCRSRPRSTIVMGFTPAENVAAVTANGDALARALSGKTGLPIKVFVAQSYAALIEGLRAGTVDFAWLGPFAFVQAEREAGARVLLKAERAGRAYYYGAIVVRADSPFHTIEDLRGRSIAWVDPTSNTGHILPLAALRARGIDADTFFSRQKYAGSHDAVVLAVARGVVDAGATFADEPDGSHGAWTRYLTGADAGTVRPIFFTERVPSDPFVTTAAFASRNPAAVTKVTGALLHLGEVPGFARILKDLYNIDAMVPATSAEYEPIRRAARLAGVPLSD